jgi:hypothetical protein
MGVERHMADEGGTDPTIGGLAQSLGLRQFGHGVGGQRLDPDGGGDVMIGEGAVVVGGGEAAAQRAPLQPRVAAGVDGPQVVMGVDDGALVEGHGLEVRRCGLPGGQRAFRRFQQGDGAQGVLDPDKRGAVVAHAVEEMFDLRPERALHTAMDDRLMAQVRARKPSAPSKAIRGWVRRDMSLDTKPFAPKTSSRLLPAAPQPSGVV